eukprot:m.78189 g.78189  ORF g.78189 m.78189 type:complete len:507 (+) comp16222_c0_seq3:242-1762(+)
MGYSILVMNTSLYSRAGCCFLVIVGTFITTFVQIQHSVHSRKTSDAQVPAREVFSAVSSNALDHESLSLAEKLSAIDGEPNQHGFDEFVQQGVATQPRSESDLAKKLMSQNILILQQAERIRALESALSASTRSDPDQLPAAAAVAIDIRKTSPRKPIGYAATGPGQAQPVDPVRDVSVTYESCMESLRKKQSAETPFRKKFPGRLFWLHFPKCGTSFGSTLHGFMCQEEPSNSTDPLPPHGPCLRCGPDAQHWRGYDHTISNRIPFEQRPYCDWSTPFYGAFKNHYALPPDNDFSSPSHVNAVALFRDPRRRLLSGWNDNKHAYAIGSYWNPRGPDDEKRVMWNSTQTIEEYAAWPGIQSCQTKMLVGEDCAVPLNVTQGIYEEAVRRLHNMAFVGLTDAFNASVCLFHHQFGGKPEEYMFTTHSRSGADLLKGKKRLQCGVGDRLPREYWQQMSPDVDPIDYQLYRVAQTVFMARLQKHGLWRPDFGTLKYICRDKGRCRLRKH